MYENYNICGIFSPNLKNKIINLEDLEEEEDEHY